MLISILLSLAVILIVRGLWVLFMTGHIARPGPVMVVLGSGGHTTEMLRWLDIAKPTRKIIFVTSATDNHSAQAAKKYDPNAVVEIIPRAREVGQSYFSSIFTTLRALLASLMIVYRAAPASIAVNGPGVCVPIVAADILLAMIMAPGRPAGGSRAALMYIESFACVEHLSLSGKILLPIAQAFVLQWPELYLKYAHSHPHKARYSGPFEVRTPSYDNDDKETMAKTPTAFRPVAEAKPNDAGYSRRRCVVTVGSTKFDELIRAVDDPRFEKALARIGIEEIFVQKGASPLQLDNFQDRNGIKSRTVVDYKHGLGADIANAALVISHAGAGTVLEAMAARVPTVVVPNSSLMANHQIELASGLHKRHHLLCAEVGQLLDQLERHDIDWQGFAPLPSPNSTSFYEASHMFFHE